MGEKKLAGFTRSDLTDLVDTGNEILKHAEAMGRSGSCVVCGDTSRYIGLAETHPKANALGVVWVCSSEKISNTENCPEDEWTSCLVMLRKTYPV